VFVKGGNDRQTIKCDRLSGYSLITSQMLYTGFILLQLPIFNTGYPLWKKSIIIFTDYFLQRKNNRITSYLVMWRQIRKQ